MRAKGKRFKEKEMGILAESQSAKLNEQNQMHRYK